MGPGFAFGTREEPRVSGSQVPTLGQILIFRIRGLYGLGSEPMRLYPGLLRKLSVHQSNQFSSGFAQRCVRGEVYGRKSLAQGETKSKSGGTFSRTLLSCLC